MAALARRRSCLAVPGGSDKMLRKAASLDADEIVLDLEDAVAPDAKPVARQMVADAIDSGLFAGRRIAVRINAIGTAWHADDVSALSQLHHGALTLVLPKAESAADLVSLEQRLGAPIGLQALIETARGLANCAVIAAATPRLESIIIGYADLASSLGRTGEASWNFVQETVLLAARVKELQAIDGPCFELAPESGRLARDCATAAAMGFDGKWAIHPSQIESINAAFTPTDAAANRARGILATLDRVRASGSGVAIFEGAMIDEAMRAGALRVLAKLEDVP